MTCAREDELLDALGRGFIGDELESHVTSCAACGDLRLVAGALLDDRVEAFKEAALPSAGTMWWRMRIRERHDAEATARRWLFIGQAMTLTFALSLVALYFGSDIVYFGTDLATTVRHMVATVRLSTPLLLAVATCALIAPIAGWVAIRQK